MGFIEERNEMVCGVGGADVGLVSWLVMNHALRRTACVDTIYFGWRWRVRVHHHMPEVYACACAMRSMCMVGDRSTHLTRFLERVALR